MQPLEKVLLVQGLQMLSINYDQIFVHASFNCRIPYAFVSTIGCLPNQGLQKNQGEIKETG